MNPQAKAEHGLKLLKEAIVELLSDTPDGLTNAEIERQLNIQSDYQGGHRSYLSWSILGLLLNEDRIAKQGRRYIKNLGE